MFAGALSAWFRLKFPHLTCGSLASSGVVLAVYNLTEFDQQEVTQLVEEKLASNPKALKATFDATEFQYGNPDKLCTPMIEAKKAGDDLVNAYANYIKEYYVGGFGAEVETYNQESLKKTTLSDSSDERLWWF
ncbi:putative peptidase S28, alpha/Beta hydrolase [Helianthus annuus]|uniref:Peptidase S28, alpha/Beta hydrolase n=1 Tax=Helianthus annuus TaxID=4232 RepID=A0A9K3E8Y7_HELAN|nr:putative peptidase S28, alpha/Beta hydrolase [Helianthus annuus]KAJ0485149.1 putative peptidase S28, alpha/Beta hydrolase [Helianthus annuus]KAJ0655699.1 putative peptidase S28, alpha/Beta hydrolase [Helianthus annuus]KAJ0839684.1 putative peptidase S28, alpha/Beta hydrolase [Helianthus annuus]